jgi:hypothetical protein
LKPGQQPRGPGIGVIDGGKVVKTDDETTAARFKPKRGFGGEDAEGACCIRSCCVGQDRRQGGGGCVGQAGVAFDLLERNLCVG